MNLKLKFILVYLSLYASSYTTIQAQNIQYDPLLDPAVEIPDIPVRIWKRRIYLVSGAVECASSAEKTERIGETLCKRGVSRQILCSGISCLIL